MTVGTHVFFTVAGERHTIQTPEAAYLLAAHDKAKDILAKLEQP